MNYSSPPTPGPPLTTDDWVFLNPNDRVLVRARDASLESGVVDVVASDASVFWIWLDGGRGRITIHESDVVQVWFEEERPWLDFTKE